jgi:tetrathionate reductase subunit A
MGMIRWILEQERYDARFLAQPNPAAAAAAGEAAWCNATHLVIAEPGHPRQGCFLRGSDLGLAIAEADRYKPADPFVVADPAGALRPHLEVSGPAQLFVDRQHEIGGKALRLRSGLDLLREAAFAHSPADYAAACGIPAETIAALAREFTSHGKRAAINTHGGTMAGNGFYNAFALVSLNTLIGNLNCRGGTFVNAGGFKHAEGPRYLLDRFEGAVTPGGTPLSRNVPYEKSTEFKRRQQAGSPYPARRPWFATAPQLATEWLPAAADGYPYALKALLLWNCNPVYGIPGLRPVAEKALGDPKVIPLVVAVDAFINETNAYADYILPDSGMYEAWGFASAWAGLPTRSTIVRWPVVEPRQAKTADGQPITLESFFIAVARTMNLPGFGPAAIRDAGGAPLPLERAEDYYLRAAANVAFTGKAPLPDASDDDVALSGVERLMPALEAVLKPDERRKVAYMLARGGRFQDADEAFDGERTAQRFTRPLQVYNEAVGTARNAMTGRRFPGVPVWTPPAFADGTPVDSFYPAAAWPLQLVSFKSPLQNSYSIAARRLRGLHPENPVILNRADAERLAVRTGDRVRIVTPGGAALAVAMVRDGVMPGVVAVEHGFGHREHGARAHRFGRAEGPSDPGIGAGVNLNDLGLADPTREGHSVWLDPVSGTAVRQGIPARIEKA